MFAENRNPRSLRCTLAGWFSSETCHCRSKERLSHLKSASTIKLSKETLHLTMSFTTASPRIISLHTFSHFYWPVIPENNTETLWFWPQSNRWETGLGSNGGRKTNKKYRSHKLNPSAVREGNPASQSGLVAGITQSSPGTSTSAGICHLPTGSSPLCATNRPLHRALHAVHPTLTLAFQPSKS